MASSIFSLLFYGVPALLVLLWVLSLWRYLRAKKKEKEQPGSVSPSALDTRRTLMIIMSVVVGALALIALGLFALLSLAVAYM
jgi:ABC-type Fe3+-siderophore transport system permease subunit